MFDHCRSQLHRARPAKYYSLLFDLKKDSRIIGCKLFICPMRLFKLRCIWLSCNDSCFLTCMKRKRMIIIMPIAFVQPTPRPATLCTGCCSIDAAAWFYKPCICNCKKLLNYSLFWRRNFWLKKMFVNLHIKRWIIPNAWANSSIKN